VPKFLFGTPDEREKALFGINNISAHAFDYECSADSSYGFAGSEKNIASGIQRDIKLIH